MQHLQILFRKLHRRSSPRVRQTRRSPDLRRQAQSNAGQNIEPSPQVGSFDDQIKEESGSPNEDKASLKLSDDGWVGFCEEEGNILQNLWKNLRQNLEA